MSDPGLISPTDDEIFEVIGVEPHAEEGEPWIRYVHIPGAPGEKIEISFDELNRSVRVRLTADGRLLLEIWRDNATRILVDRRKVTVFVFEFEIGATKSELTVQTHPFLSIRDVTMRLK